MRERWQFGVLVRSHDRCEYFGLATTYLEAVELQRAAFAAGWDTAKIFDTTLSEVTEPQKRKSPALYTRRGNGGLCSE
jgi:hypothetical protein